MSLIFLGCMLTSSGQANLTQPRILERLNTSPIQIDTIDRTENNRERALFEQAEEALQEGRMERFKELSERLAAYPLYPYLQLQALRHRLDEAGAAEISAMLDRYEAIPLAGQIRAQWLEQLSQDGQWQTLLAHLPETLLRQTTHCHALQARAETGDRAAVMEAVPALWLTGRSLPNACDPVLDYWRAQGGLTDDLAWQRLALAVKAGHSGLARYLRRYLPDELQAAANRFIQVHGDPDVLENRERFAKGDPHVTEIVAHGMIRYSHREPEKAAALWPYYQNALPFTPAQASAVKRSLGLMLAVQYDPQAQALLKEARAVSDDPSLYEWQVRVFLRNGDWQAVAESIKAFPASLRETTRWQYWLARAEEQLGAHDDAQARYAKASQERNFYGFMAADRLGTPYHLNHQSHPFTAEDILAVSRLPAVKRAYEFFQLDRLPEARREWRDLLGRLDTHQVLVASHLAQSWGWYEQGIMGAIAVQQWDDLHMRFPLAYQELFTNQSTLRKLDVNWVYALARQESAFMHDARSPAGALGLLQLLPSTARQTAREIGMTFHGSEQLMTPAANIRLGTAHLSELLERFDNNRILATAAYNAGANRVEEWLENGGDQLDADVWIETMPYYETRQYVQNVLAYTVIYGYRRGEPPGYLLTKRELACLCALPES